jgi:hypothetical protein
MHFATLRVGEIPHVAPQILVAEWLLHSRR